MDFLIKFIPRKHFTLNSKRNWLLELFCSTWQFFISVCASPFLLLHRSYVIFCRVIHVSKWMHALTYILSKLSFSKLHWTHLWLNCDWLSFNMYNYGTVSPSFLRTHSSPYKLDAFYMTVCKTVLPVSVFNFYSFSAIIEAWQYCLDGPIYQAR